MQTDASHFADRSRATIRIRRLDALFRAQRAREVLDRETEVAERAIDRSASTLDDEHRDDGPPAGHAAERSTTTDDDVERLIAIHQSLRHERQVARRPFHNRSQRLVLALELAERLALERLGFADYAAFEASGGGEAPEPDVIDLVRIERAQRELAEAEAVLAEISAGHDQPWHEDPAADPWTRDDHPVRTTLADGPDRTDRTGGGRARSLFDVPRDLDRYDIDIGNDLAFDLLTDAGLERRQPASGGDAPSSALPTRASTQRGRPAGRSSRAPSDDAGAGEDGSATSFDAALGEVVHDGRRLRIERIPGLAYDADDDSSTLGPDSISYRDPTAGPEPR